MLPMVEARTGTAAGLICLLHRQQPGVVGVGYWIVASRRRKGLTLASLVLLSRWALHLSAIDRLEALVDPGNEAPIGVLNGAGFRHEALLRSCMDLEERRSDAVLYCSRAISNASLRSSQAANCLPPTSGCGCAVNPTVLVRS